METRTILIAKNYNPEHFYSRMFLKESEAINHGERIFHQDKGDVITYIKEKKNNHRWDIEIIDDNRGIIYSTVTVNSKKSAKLAAKALREYDESLKIEITKIY
jgi:hypothetical protein